MAKRTVADQFVEILLAAGVRRMYGVVGDSLNPVVDAVRRHDGIDWVHVRHEKVGAFAAGAEAQPASGHSRRPAVALTSGNRRPAERVTRQAKPS
jgi:thiamine pyrophosphate-dependent acetolactate synthase large subunit-like protein